ncbi:winged helix-turn-helix domain-containing protein [Bacillus sp. SL00103]
MFSREQLYQKLWESHSTSGSLRTVDTHIKTLRLKLKGAERHIKTVWVSVISLRRKNEAFID